MALLLLPTTSSSSSLSLVTDEQALLSFKSLITSDPSNAMSSWISTSARNTNSTNICTWKGVFCNKQQDRVSGVDLSGKTLSGILTPNVGNLTFLRFLLLQSNHFSGFLPDQIGRLRRLQLFNISSNFLNGQIPNSITNCTNLTALDLSGNKFSGQIPPELQQLRKLRIIKLGQNQLTGPIPISIANNSALTYIDLGTNSISGSIPDGLSHLKKLQHLQLSINNIEGIVPPSLYNQSSLVTFAIASNNLHGEIPADIGFRLPKLLVFHVCYNEFTGKIPPSLHNVTRIQSLRMSHNFFHGTIPPGLDKLSELVMYNIGFNLLFTYDGLQFLSYLTNSTKLQFLAFDGNSFEGIIPVSVGNLSSVLTKLYMGENRIHGNVPESIGRLTGLELLNMSSNYISGEIPQNISQLSNLQMLGLAGNGITGRIPEGLGELRKLNKLEIYGNDLEGNIPSTFANFKSLLYLDLSGNKLDGSIPREVFFLITLTSLLNLSNNYLSGFLPPEIGRMVNVISIDISNNLISGNIPLSTGSCQSLQVLSLANNLLSGLIPDSIGNISGLQKLDLSSNHLSGSIPSDLADLHALQLLNLSFNNLEGVAPKGGVFRNSSEALLEGNPKLCWGNSSCKTSSSGKNWKAAYTAIILSVSICTLCLLVFSALFFVKRTFLKNISTATNSIKTFHQWISYDEILRATKNLSSENLIGTGSFGSVFRGALIKEGSTTATAVAIKVLDLSIRGASKSFIAECEALRNVRHRNLVKLITSCSSCDFANNDFLALVYEFMGNGSLDDWLRGRRRHEEDDHKGLSLEERLDIAIDIASAMDYLHHDCDAPVVHCDLKPSNVLLDAEMMAKVGDFGLARLIMEKDGISATSSEWLKGTLGYIPPEYGLGGRPSTKGDVYSFGVMLLELLTGKSPTQEMSVGGGEALCLEKWVRSLFPDKLLQVIDPKLLPHDQKNHKISFEGSTLVSMARVGLSCALESPESRISMRVALHQLKIIKDSLNKLNKSYIIG